MSKLIVEVTKDLHDKLRERALSESKSIKEIITDLVDNFLGEEKQSEKYQIIPAVKTGLETQPTWPDIDRRQKKEEENKRPQYRIW